MSSPRLGVVRDSMLTNPLFIKAPLGRSRSRGLVGPGPGFTFGTSSSSRDGGVAEVLSGWQVQSRRGDSAPHDTAPPDFLSLNRDAVRSGLVTSKELSQYRALRGGATRKSSAPRPQEGGASQRHPIPDVRFGVRNRTPSPMSDLLAHQYARRWVDLQLSRGQNLNQQHRMKPGNLPETRTSMLRRNKVLQSTQAPPTLPRRSQVFPALDTFRDSSSRLRAFRSHQTHQRPGQVDQPDPVQHRENTHTKTHTAKHTQ